MLQRTGTGEMPPAVYAMHGLAGVKAQRDRDLFATARKCYGNSMKDHASNGCASPVTP